MSLIRCEKCGAEVDSLGKFCANCGNKISAQTVCKFCNGTIENGNSVCSACGKDQGLKKLNNSFALKFISYAMSFVAFLIVLMGKLLMLTWIPLVWGIAFHGYSSQKEKEGYEVGYYKKLKRDNYIIFVICIIFAIIWNLIWAQYA